MSKDILCQAQVIERGWHVRIINPTYPEIVRLGRNRPVHPLTDPVPPPDFRPPGFVSRLFQEAAMAHRDRMCWPIVKLADPSNTVFQFSTARSRSYDPEEPGLNR